MKNEIIEKKGTVYGKHVFAENEKQQIATDLAEKVQERKRIEDELTSMKSSFKSRLDLAEATINKLSVDYACGYEMRMIPCKIILDVKKHEKTFYEIETNVIIKTEELTDEELQKNLFVEK
jgi:hypothetical protein